MTKRDPRVDDYIAKAAAFAKPILERLREVIHEACPEVEETIRWSVPSFNHHGMLCNTAAFKAYCYLVFWKAPLVEGAENLGKLTTVDDLPPKKVLARMVKDAAKLNEEGVTVPKARKPEKSPPKAPEALVAALKKNEPARAAFEKMPPSHRREYAEWIAGAKRDETRERRIAKAVAQLAEGKSLNSKYER